MRQGGKSREGMNFWYDQRGLVRIFYAQFGNASIKYEIEIYDENQASDWRKNVYARAEKHFGITRGRYAHQPA